MKNFFKIFVNPYIGPIIVSSIVIGYLLIVIIPKLSHENKVAQLTSQAESSVNKLKKIRSYYTSNVISKVKKAKELSINYDHFTENKTIPLPATLLHNLSNILPENGVTIKMFSSHPFPNRANRVLNSHEKESLAWIENNPFKTHTKIVEEGDEKFLKVTVSDIFYDQACVNCHNTRIDTPKNDWEIGDVRGVLQVSLPFKDGIVLTNDETIKVLVFLVLLIAVLGIHYTFVSFRRQQEHNDQQDNLEQKVIARTKTLNEYKRAVDYSAIVSKTDKDGNITYVNDAFVKISQFDREELIGKNHNLIKHPDMPIEVFEDLWKTIKSKNVWKGQIRNRAKDGSSYYVASTIVPILDANNEIDEFLAVRFDISDIVESRIEAERADLAKSTFLANMSHEIRTPLNAIIGFSQVLSSSKELNIENSKQAAIIETSANSLLGIINDILDVSKIESGNFEVSLDNTDLYFICEHVVELFSKRAIEKDISLIFNMDHKIPLCVQTDGIRIRQVLSNLLGNAIKFTDKHGKIYLNLTLLENPKGNSIIRFEVIDTGIGIDQDKLKNIFNPFIQVDSHTNRKYEGTGLGLSISSHIIESLHSEIHVESEINKGSKFWFDLELETCDDTFFKKDHYVHDLELKVLNEKSDLYHYVKRYLHIFGNITFEEDSKLPDILVCNACGIDVEKIDNIRETFKDTPKLILFENENIMSMLKLEDDEIAISLPFYASKVNDALQELINRSDKKVETKERKKATFDGKVLVAEDNTANQELISYILNSMEVEFDIANNGQEAFDLYKQNNYNIVLMDINMPVLDGIDSFKKIREYEKEQNRSETAVIALTANAIKGDKERFLELGMNDYLSKPIDTDKLNLIFAKYLQKNTKVETNEKEEPSSSQNNETKIDVEKIVKKLGISKNIAQMLVNKFKKEIPDDLNELEKFIKDNDFENIKNKAHYIKNSCLNLGLDEICETIQNIETKEKDIEKIKQLFKKVKESILELT